MLLFRPCLFFLFPLSLASPLVLTAPRFPPGTIPQVPDEKTFVIDCSLPAEEGIFDVPKFVSHMAPFRLRSALFALASCPCPPPPPAHRCCRGPPQEEYLQARVKVNGKTGQLAGAIEISRSGNKVTVHSLNKTRLPKKCVVETREGRRLLTSLALSLSLSFRGVALDP